MYFYLALWVTMFMSERQSNIPPSFIIRVHTFISFPCIWCQIIMFMLFGNYVLLWYDTIRIIFPFSINIKAWKRNENIYMWWRIETEPDAFSEGVILNGIPMTIISFLDIGYIIAIYQKLICIVTSAIIGTEITHLHIFLILYNKEDSRRCWRRDIFYCSHVLGLAFFMKIILKA